ncbi:MAG: CNNM domain-containing protein [Algisphaera sp.]
MTSQATFFWSALTLAGLAGSALFSGLETGTYTLNRVRLQVYADRGRRTAMRLRQLLDQPAALLATLLIGNNLANYLGTFGLAVLLEAAAFGPGQAVLLNVLIITPLLFVFGETLPKDMMAAHGDRLMYPLTPVLSIAHRLFTAMGLVPLIQLFSRLAIRIMKLKGDPTTFAPRRRVQLLVREGVGHGALSDEQSAIVDRVLQLSGRRVHEEMVPWNQVVTLSLNDTPNRLWQLAERSGRSRFPVCDAAGKVLGVIDLFDALLHGQKNCPPIAELLSPITRIHANHPLREALQTFQRQGLAIAVVEETQGGAPVGLITVKDLVEPITGELTTW